MPEFAYRGLKGDGAVLSGTVPARDRSEAVRKLVHAGVQPFELIESVAADRVLRESPVNAVAPKPSEAEAGVLAWTEPGYDLGQVPFDHWVEAIRAFPICDLPRLETTLETGEKD